jgi:hypothetical protein
MQLAKQSTAKALPKRRPPKRGGAHAGTMQAIHATWRKVAPPTVVDAEDLRIERLNFATRVLNLNEPLESLNGLSGAQLGRVLDAMRELERAPTVVQSPKSKVQGPDEAEAEIHHLATTAQVEAIDKLFASLEWFPTTVEKFLLDKFKTKSQRMLTVKQANSCTMILFNIAASFAIRAQFPGVPVSRAMIRREIPALKRRLGIDQKSESGQTKEENPDD